MVVDNLSLIHISLAQNALNRAEKTDFAPYKSIEGLEYFDKVIDINQSPIGRTPRSNPATYTGLFTPIRELFAGVPEARARGYNPGRFSFNAVSYTHLSSLCMLFSECLK